MGWVGEGDKVWRRDIFFNLFILCMQKKISNIFQLFS